MKSVLIVLVLFLAGCAVTVAEMPESRKLYAYKSGLAPRAAANCMVHNQLQDGKMPATIVEAPDGTLEVAAQSMTMLRTQTITQFYAKVAAADSGSTIRLWAGSPFEDVGQQTAERVTKGCL